jgi:hypothetical protein
MPRKATPQNKTPTAGQLERLREELEHCRRQMGQEEDRLCELEARLEARLEERLEQLGKAVAGLRAAADEVEFCYRHRGLCAIRVDGKEHPLFTELFRAADKTGRLLAE